MEDEVVQKNSSQKALEVLVETALPKEYQSQAKQYLDYLRSSGQQLGAESASEFIEQKRKDGYQDRSGVHQEYQAQGINGYIFAIKKLLRAMLDHSPNLTQAQAASIRHWVTELKPLKVNKEQKQIGEDKVISPQELKALLDQAGERDALFIEFLAVTGCRISETLKIKLSQMTKINGHYDILVIGKGQKKRTVRVRADLIERIVSFFKGQEYLFETSGGKPYARNYVFLRFKRLGNEVLGRPIYPHMLRHTFATEMLKMYPEDLAGISGYMGHAKVSSTADMYIHGKLSFAKLNGYHAKIKGEDQPDE